MKVVNLTKTCPTIKELQQSFVKVKELCMLETSKEFWSMDSTWLTSLEASRYVVMNKLASSLARGRNSGSLFQSNVCNLVFPGI